MSGFVSKLTIYDILAMILPGCCISWSLYILYPCLSGYILDLPGMGYELVRCLVLVTAFYIVGLLLHWLMAYIWSLIGLRNRPEHIYEAARKLSESGKYQITASMLSADDQIMLDRYYTAYEYVQQKCESNPIPMLEGQAAMLRNMILPAFVCIMVVATALLNSVTSVLSCGVNDFLHMIVFVLDLLLSVLLGYVAVIIQKKIYSLVFEHYEYLNKVKYA